MRWTRTLLLLIGLAIPWPAAARSTFTLALDPLQSSFAPEGDAPVQELSGILSFEVDSLPLVANATLELLEVQVDSSGGLEVILDPSLETPGLGVLFTDASLLIPTLFLRISTGGEPVDLAVTDVTGEVELASPTEIVAVGAGFDIDTDPLTAGVGRVDIVAVPEPGTEAAITATLAALAACHVRRKRTA
jgi:hypothetical protein